MQDNVLVSLSGNALVADFGISHALAATTAFATTTGGVKGTVRWMAIELFTGSLALSQFSKAADVWAFGMTIYVRPKDGLSPSFAENAIYSLQEILTKLLPYNELRTDAQVMTAIVSGEKPSRTVDAQTGAEVDPLLWDLSCECWDNDLSNRPSMAQVARYLDHLGDAEAPSVCTSCEQCRDILSFTLLKVKASWLLADVFRAEALYPGMLSNICSP